MPYATQLIIYQKQFCDFFQERKIKLAFCLCDFNKYKKVSVIEEITGIPAI